MPFPIAVKEMAGVCEQELDSQRKRQQLGSHITDEHHLPRVPVAKKAETTGDRLYSRTCIGRIEKDDVGVVSCGNRVFKCLPCWIVPNLTCEILHRLRAKLLCLIPNLRRRVLQDAVDFGI